ncbi:MAG: SCO family protein [Candidatus Thalassarchaeaceae archaeon]|nr:SCO family protein [Candidatus Thalassarchaeaceae archaeon]
MKQVMAILLAICIFLPGCTAPAEELDAFHGDDLPGNDPEYAVSEFSLTKTDGDMTNLSDYDGQVLVVSFIYSRCPDVCPVVSSNLRWISQELAGDYGTNFSIISITVDPWWDSQYNLNQYATLRNLSWPHLTGDVAVLEPVWEAFHVGLQTYANNTYEDDSNNTSGRHHPDYLVDHSTATIILDKDHQQRVRWDDLDWEPTLFAEDVQQLMDE